jgi:hypothetical protein
MGDLHAMSDKELFKSIAAHMSKTKATGEIFEDVISMVVSGEMSVEQLRVWYDRWVFSSFSEVSTKDPKKISEELLLENLSERMRELYLESLEEIYKIKERHGVQSKRVPLHSGHSKENGSRELLPKTKSRGSVGNKGWTYPGNKA